MKEFAVTDFTSHKNQKKGVATATPKHTHIKRKEIESIKSKQIFHLLIRKSLKDFEKCCLSSNVGDYK
ncbi:hypothetical protein HMPREF2572_00210 [Neisseria sp. HMSC064E01]|nr:hypothetical protein HMPREF2572_00210 [Neisseria sp. HMSC064E01]